MAAVRDVEIDPEGTFKYILVLLQRPGGGEGRHIVRGTAAAEFHNHIFEKVNPELAKLGYECKCLGGGKIDHNSKDKKIRVFGLSTEHHVKEFYCPEGFCQTETYPEGQITSVASEPNQMFACSCVQVGQCNHCGLEEHLGYGKADHSVTVEILKKVYTDYEITWSDHKK